MTPDEILELARTVGSDKWCSDDYSLLVLVELIQGRAYREGCLNGWVDCMNEHVVPRIGKHDIGKFEIKDSK
jgi:hypothetical protein